MNKQFKNKDAGMFEQKIHPLEKLINEKRMPILFIGSGISRRYLDFCTWDALLEDIASIMGIDRFQLNGIKKMIESEHPDVNIYPLLASNLSERMVDMIGEKTLTRNDFPNMSKKDWELMETIDPFKVTVCSFLKDGKLTTNADRATELESFRKLSSKIPAVITTNYDNFLEKEIFTDFNTLVYPDDYYFSGSEGYGEILKIHGTVDNPDSIVITAKDYEKLQKDSKVVLSRLTYLLCYHPVIFIGYSLRDDEIYNLIYDLVSSLKKTDIEKIRGNIIKVHVSDRLKKSIWKPEIIDSGNKRIEIINLEVPTPEVLFRYIDRFTPVASPIEIKRYKDMISEIVLSTGPTSKRITMINESGISSMTSKDYAVLFGDAGSINSIMKGITGYDISDVLKDVLMDRKGLLDNSKPAFIEWVSQKRICSGDKYIPLFHYYLKYNIDYRALGDDLIHFTDHMIERIESKIDNMSRKCNCDLAHDDIDDFLSSQVRSFPRCEALMYFQSIGKISKEDCRKRLLNLYESGMCLDEKGNMKTDIRCAISHLDLQEYRNKCCAEPRTLSH